MVQEDWILNLEDNEWPLTTIDHDRMIARASGTAPSKPAHPLLNARAMMMNTQSIL